MKFMSIFVAVLIAFTGCAVAPKSQSLEAWDADMEYSAHDGKYYHRHPPPSVHDVIARDAGRD